MSKELILSMVAAGVVSAAADSPFWAPHAPEALPQVTVRWEEGRHRDVAVIEGERYQCRVGLNPAAILSLRVDGTDLLGPEGLHPGFQDVEGKAYGTVPPGAVPDWETWQGQNWKPATSSKARFNIWRSGPYYWEAHVLDIPLVPMDEAVAAAASGDLPVLREWTFAAGAGGWEPLNQCSDFAVADGVLAVTYAGNDPYFQGPETDAAGPLAVRLRLRSLTGGGLAVYWIEEGQAGYDGSKVAIVPVASHGDWQTVDIPLRLERDLRRLRIDPPGNQGRIELAAVQLVQRPAGGGPKPVRGEIVFHAFADRLNVEFRLDPVADRPAPRRAHWRVDTRAAAPATAADRPALLLGSGPAGAGVLGVAGAAFTAGEWHAPLSGDRPGTHWVVRPVAGGAAPTEVFAEELDPLPASAVRVAGGHWLGYDPAPGLYRLASQAQPHAYAFNQAYDNPGRQQIITVQMAPAERARRVFCSTSSGTGILPATVLTDVHGLLLPTPILSSKNFAGEREEPDDSAFGDAVFPLHVAAGQPAEFQVRHLFQQWGQNLVQQVSSIRFFHIYWHLSQGVSETTCFTISWMKINGVFVRIPDFRPYSGPFWPGQPQHDCRSWPGLLQYRSGGHEVPLVYDKTVFESIAPCLSRFTMHFHGADGATRATMTAMEFPQRDEMRTFLRLRYDWDAEVRIDGDARKTFRWLNMNDKQTPRCLVWLDADDKPRSVDLAPDAKPFLGLPLGRVFPYIGSHDQGGYHAFVLVRSFRARLGGREQDQVHAAADYGPRHGDYWLTVANEELVLQPGDYVEAEVMLVPHAEPTEPGAVPQRERVRYGSSGPRVEEVRIGTKLADFPPRILADDEAAMFTVKGGHQTMPLIVEGFAHWSFPLLWEGPVWVDQQVHGGDGYQVNPAPGGGYRFVFAAPMRDEQTRHWTVTRAHCSTGIRKVGDANGFPRIEAVAPGAFSLQAPILFAPGENRIRRGAPLVAFSGRGAAVQGVPISVVPTDETALVEVLRSDAEGCELLVEGVQSVTFGGLAAGATYVVRLGDREETRRTGGSLVLSLEPGTRAVSVIRQR